MCTSLKKIYYRLGSGLVKNLRVGNNAEIIPYKREQFVETQSEDTSTEDNVWRETKNIQWRISKGTLTIRGTGDMDDKMHRKGGCPWRDNNFIKKVIIKEGITSISYGAFTHRESLLTVELPVGLREIKFRAFSYCTNLTGMIIPEGVVSIGNQAFYGCESMEFLVLPETLVSIEDEAFAHCYSLKNVVIPAMVEKIGYGIFSDCENLMTIHCRSRHFFLAYKLRQGNDAELIRY